MEAKKLLSVIVTALFIVCLSVALAQESTDSNAVQSQSWGQDSGHPGSGELDWTAQIVKSTGIGVINPNAQNVGQARVGCLRAARVTAQRNLLEIIQGVNIDSETTVENFMTTSDVVKTQVHGVLQGAQRIGQPDYMDDGTCELTMGVRVTGELADILLPPEDDFGGKQDEVPSGPQKVYSGLVVNAFGLSAVPAMSPKIVDEDGNEIYGTSHVSREYAVEQGVVGYAKSVEQARENSRVADNPLVIQAVEAAGSKKANVVITNEDAEKLEDDSIDWSFLNKCKVIIVL